MIVQGVLYQGYRKMMFQSFLQMAFEPRHDKTENVVSEQVQHSPNCTTIEDS